VILETKRSREAIARIGAGNRLRELEQFKAFMDLPPPPTETPVHALTEANSSQRKAHNREGYGMRVLESKGATYSFKG